MTAWPKNPNPRVPGDSPLEPVGPLNVFNEKLAHAEAINRAHATKKTFDKDYVQPTALPRSVEAPPVPLGPPVSTGGPIKTDESEYVIELHHRRR